MNCDCFAGRLSHVTWMCKKDETPKYKPQMIEIIQEKSVVIRRTNEKCFVSRIFVHHGKVVHSDQKFGQCYLKMIICIGSIKVVIKVIIFFAIRYM